MRTIAISLALLLTIISINAYAEEVADNCGLLGKGFISREKTEMGLSPQGAIMGNASIYFTMRKADPSSPFPLQRKEHPSMDWMKSDLGGSLAYSCDNGRIKFYGSGEGTYDSLHKQVVWDGMIYEEKEQK